MAETVTVEADAGRLQIQSESAERSDLVTNKQLRDLALNGRNITDLFKTIPGVMAGGTITSSTVQNVVGSFNINGTRSNQHEYTVDGVTNLNLGNNTGALVRINPDALEEVKILTSNYQAEYGRAGGGFIALTTRSGTNEYRGGLRYFRRHESYNANNFFNSANNRPKPPYRFNYYGWDFGGPGAVPRHARRTQGLLLRRPGVLRAADAGRHAHEHPRAHRGRARRRLLADARRQRHARRHPRPAHRPALPRQRHPVEPVLPGHAGLLGIFPLPNAPEGGALYNYTSQLPRDIPRREDISRVDWQIARARGSAPATSTTRTRTSAPGHDHGRLQLPARRASCAGTGRATTLSLDPDPHLQPVPDQRVHLRRGAGRGLHRPRRRPRRRARARRQHAAALPAAPIPDTMPSVRFLGIPGQACPATGVRCASDQLQRHAVRPALRHQQLHEQPDQDGGAHTVQGRALLPARQQPAHVVRARAVEHRLRTTTHPQNTGHPFANALLGVFDSYTQAEQKIASNWFYQNISGYLQDTWKVRPRLTLDYGLRVSHYQPIYDREDRLGFFNPELFDPARAVRLYRPVCVGSPCAVRAIDPAVTGAPTLANTRPANYVDTDRAGLRRPPQRHRPRGRRLSGRRLRDRVVLWGPRLGFAWDLSGDGKTVVRGGFGISYDRVDTDRIADAITNPPGIQVRR